MFDREGVFNTYLGLVRILISGAWFLRLIFFVHETLFLFFYVVHTEMAIFLLVLFYSFVLVDILCPQHTCFPTL